MTWACSPIIAWLGPDLCRAVDHYCERTNDTWYAEPFNAFSNLAFFIAGWAAWRSLGRARDLRNTWLPVLTVALIPVVGLGSFAFHTLATRWAEWLDVVPIGLFLTFYLWLALEMFLKWSFASRLAAIGLFLIATFASENFISEDVLWGGAMYLPTLVALLFLTAFTIGTKNSSSMVFVCASGGFLVAYTMRTIDNAVCPILPIGTHMMWHLLNAALMYLLVHLLVARAIASSLVADEIAGKCRAQRTSSD